MLLSVFSSSAGRSIVSNLTSTTMLPWSVITGPAFLTPIRSSGLPPSASIARITGAIAIGITSTGTGKLEPSLSTTLELSTTTINCSAR